MNFPIKLKKTLATALKHEKGLNFIVALYKKFPEAEVYLVGGIVRDWLLNRASHDFDFVVRGIPVTKLAAFLKTQGKVNLVGERFGVFKFVPKNSKATFDIALPRIEHALGTGGYRDVETQSDYKLPITEDLARRDFTINAVALKLSIKNKKIIIADLVDPFNGQKDIRKKIIKTVGEAEIRFQEDYSRLLRALRFAVQLNFNIEETTWWMLMQKMSQINAQVNINKEVKRLVPYEVIAKEFIKSLMSNPLKAFDTWDKANVFEYIAPELLKMKNCPQPPEFHQEGDVWQHTRIALDNLSSKGFKKFVKTLPGLLQEGPLLTPDLVIGVMFHDLGKPYTIKTPEKDGTDRIRTDEHDSAGAKLVKEIGERLRLTSVADYPCDLDRIAWMIQRHLLLVHGEPMKFTNHTVEKNFFTPKNPGAELLKLIYTDQMASFVGGKPQLGSLPIMVKRIKQLLKSLGQKKILPPPLLNGHEVMKIMKIKSGPDIGEILEKLRGAQLDRKIKTKQEAKKFLNKIK